MASILGLNRTEKLQLLGERSPLGAYLSSAELNRLAKLCSIVCFSKGKSIQADSPFYLVIDGVVSVMDDDEVSQRASASAPASASVSLSNLTPGPHTRAHVYIVILALIR